MVTINTSRPEKVHKIVAYHGAYPTGNQTHYKCTDITEKIWFEMENMINEVQTFTIQ